MRKLVHASKTRPVLIQLSSHQKHSSWRIALALTLPLFWLTLIIIQDRCLLQVHSLVLPQRHHKQNLQQTHLGIFQRRPLQQPTQRRRQCFRLQASKQDGAKADANKKKKKPKKNDSSSNKHDNEPSDPRELWEALDSKFDYQGKIALPDDPTFRSGYVAVIGAANMGKSTLVNALLEEELCIATRRPQTTRHAILGILSSSNNNNNNHNSQVCLVDTPGILAETSYQLQANMMEAVSASLKDADVLLVVTDLFSTPIPNDDVFAYVQNQQGKRNIVVVINKIDLITKVNSDSSNKKISDKNNNNKKKRDSDKDTSPETALPKTVTVEDAVARWRQLLPQALAILPTCASEGSDNPGVIALRALLTGSPDLPQTIRNLGRPIPGMFLDNNKPWLTDVEAQQLLPLGPPLYDAEFVTDRSERFVASEMIRAVLLETFQKELPYCCHVVVTKFKASLTLIKMDATIFVERPSQQKIVIGAGGRTIKQVGILARKRLEHFFRTKLYLQLQVKVDKDWRQQTDKLQKYGY